MKMKSTFATLAIGACLTVPLLSYADCYSVYTNATAACDTAEQNTDTTAWNTYNALDANAWNTYNTTVAQDVITQTTAQAVCLSTYYLATGDPNVFNDVGTCGAALVAADTVADNTYQQAVTACGTNEQCICRAVTARDYSKNSASDAAWQCQQDHLNTYNQCVANSQATQHQGDRTAYAAYITSGGTAQANCYKTLLSAIWTASRCNNQASTAYANCQLNPNDCSDKCKIDQNNDHLSAYNAFVDSYAPAAAQYEYDSMMCSVTQNHDDQVSYAQWGYTTDTANATFSYNQTLAWNLEQYTFLIDIDQKKRDEDLCTCNYTDDTHYNLCIATAEAAKTAADGNAVAAYQQKHNVPPANPTGDNWNTWNAAITDANTTLQAAYASHLLTEQTCVQNAANIANADYNSATRAYNNAINAADTKYNNCLQGCNGA